MCAFSLAHATVAENHNMLHELNVEKVLLELLSGDDDRVTTAASQAVSAMSSNPASKEVFRQLGTCAITHKHVNLH